MGGLNRKKDQRALKHARNEALNPPTEHQRGTYSPPSRHRCEEREFPFVAQSENGLTTYGHTWHQAGRLVDFFIELRTYCTEHARCETVFSIDCAHGSAHTHTYDHGKKDPGIHKVLRVLDCEKDVRVALGVSISKINEYRSGYEGKGGENE